VDIIYGKHTNTKAQHTKKIPQEREITKKQRKMSWILNAINKSSEEQSQQVGEDDNVFEVVQHMQTSNLYEDKVEAMNKLVELSAQVSIQKEFAKNDVFQTLVQMLDNQRDDLEMTRQLLEIVLNLTHSEKFGDQYLSVIVNNGYVSTVLHLLEENDHYIKYHTTKLITILLRHNIQLVQQSILAEASVSKLVSLVDDQEDIIRNEGLLLLNTLTHFGNTEIKKIIAFEGAFEKLFRIIFEEGGNNGGIIVQDCLLIIHNLLYENESNQVCLCEKKRNLLLHKILTFHICMFHVGLIETLQFNQLHTIFISSTAA
jgi:hypothetical protein